MSTPTRSRGRLTVLATPTAHTAEHTPNPDTGSQHIQSGTRDTQQDADEKMSTGRRGPLVAVCGLCGGAGASTLTWLIATAQLAHHPAGQVLAADTGGPGSQLAAYARVQAPRSLTEAAELAAAARPVGQLVAATAEGLRVLASGPRFATDCQPDGVALLLEHARAHFALSVIDCGTLARQADQIVLAAATHVVWVLPATVSRVRTAGRVLEQVHPALPATELVVARHDPTQPKAPMRKLRLLAAQRNAPLILMPAVGDLAGSSSGQALEVSQISMQAIHRQLRR